MDRLKAVVAASRSLRSNFALTAPEDFSPEPSTMKTWPFLGSPLGTAVFIVMDALMRAQVLTKSDHKRPSNAERVLSVPIITERSADCAVAK